MRTLMAFLVLSLLAAAADAQTPPACSGLSTATPIPWDETRLTWTLPTTNTDGSALAGPASVTVYRRSGTTGAYSAQCVTAPGAAGTSMLAQPSGQQFYVLTARVGSGPESMQSATVSKTIAPVPNPPTNVTVVTDLVAWMLVQSQDRVAMIPVGTVAPGTACDTTQAVTGVISGAQVTKYVVPRSAVTFAGSARPQVVLASCG